MKLNEVFQRWACNNPPPKSQSHKTQTKKEVKQERKSSKNKKVKAKSANDGWSVDTSAEATAQRMNQALPDAMKEMVAGSEDAIDIGLDKPIQRLSKFLESKPNIDKLIDKVEALKAKHELDSRRTMVLLLRTLSPKLGQCHKKVNPYKDVWLEFVDETPTEQARLLAALEHRYKTETDKDEAKTFLKHFPSTLKAFYDAEVLDEDAIFAWHTKSASDAALVKNATPFVKWLKEADEEDDEEDDDENENENENDTKTKKQPKENGETTDKKETKPNGEVENNNEDSDSDFDLDAELDAL